MLKEIYQFNEKHDDEVFSWCFKHADKADCQLAEAFVVYIQPVLEENKKAEK